MPCYSPLKGYKSRETGGIVFRRGSDAGEKMAVACGQCLGCRLDRSQTWAMRIVHEASEWDENSFLTLTYDDSHVPRDGSLRPSDFQKFMKRLRKKFGDRKIRYYHCGEYGDELHRPHYHACLFNLDFPDKELVQEREGNALFSSETLEELWPYGFSTVGELTFQSAAYVSRYCLKKVTGAKAHDHYLRCDENGEAYWLHPEYVTMSRGHRCKDHRGEKERPESCRKCSGGIGEKWLRKYASDVFPSGEVPVPGQGVFRKVPRYYEDVFARTDPDLVERVKAARRRFRESNAEEYSPHRLEQKYKVKKAQVEQLKRTVS